MAGIDNIFGIHEQALRVRSKRIEMIANNIANVDTPGYKARDLDFKAILAKQASEGNQLAITNDKHIKTAVSPAGGQTLYRIPTQPSVDGNTVEIDVEKAEFAKNAIEYQATFSFLNGKIRSLMTAIKGQ